MPPSRPHRSLRLHDRTGRLENRPAVDITFSALHDRTGRLEIIMETFL